MEQALYHPEHGYYSSGRCAIGRRGDYFTSVSVGPLFGKLLAGQFAEIWRALGRPNDFVIVEQGAHHGEFATDVLESAARREPGILCDAALPDRGAVSDSPTAPAGVLASVCREDGMVRVSRGDGAILRRPFFQRTGRCDAGASDRRRRVPKGGNGTNAWSSEHRAASLLCDRPITDPRLRAEVAKIPPPPRGPYETEINLAALDWIDDARPSCMRGVVLDRRLRVSPAGLLCSRSQHRHAAMLLWSPRPAFAAGGALARAT